MADRIQMRRDTAACWSQYNPILLEGEVGYLLDNPNQYKVGDGEHAWNDLPLRGGNSDMQQASETELGGIKAATKTDNETVEAKIDPLTGKLYVPAGGGSGEGGTSNYNDLSNKPKINSVELSGNKSATDLGLVASESGKGLSSNDYTASEKSKLAGIENEANKTIVEQSLTTSTTNVPSSNAVKTNIDTLTTKVNALSGIDSPFVGYYDEASKLPTQTSAAWALVGDLATAKPYAYYVSGNVPSGYSEGWNDLSAALGTYDFTELSGYVKKEDYLVGETYTKETFPNPSVGLFKSDGTLNTSYSDYRTSDYISLENIDTITYNELFPNVNSLAGGFIYNADKERVLQLNNSGTLKVLENYKYIRISSYTANTYVALNYDNQFHDLVNHVDDIEQSLPVLGETNNLLNPYEIMDGFYLDRNGELKALSNYWTTGNIPVEVGRYVVSSLDGEKYKSFCLVIYDSSNTILEIYSAQETPLNTHNVASLLISNEEASYIRLSFEDISPKSNIQIEINDTGEATKYRPYNYREYADYPLRDSLKGINELGISVETSEIYGYSDSVGTLNFPEENYKYLVTTANSACKKGGILSKVYVRTSTHGKMKLAVGLLDQNSRAVLSSTFDVYVENTLNNTIDVLDQNINISEGEQLFAYIRYYGEGTPGVLYKLNEEENEHEYLYGAVDGILAKLPTEYGGQVLLAYTVNEIESPFALKAEITQVNEALKSQQETINTIGLVYDENGNPYRLKVINGELTVVPANYKKVLALGNSLTNHPTLTSIGYYGGGWAMAASIQANGWVSLLQEVLRQKNAEATVEGYNISEWENNYLNVDLSELLDEKLTSDLDLIIFRAGENNSDISSSEEYQQGVDRLITYIKTKCPAATIIMTSLFWHNGTKETAIQAVAQKYGLTYVYTSDVGNNKCRMGDYTMGNDDVLHPIINQGVANHMNDIGYLLWTNILARVLGYNELNYLHSVNVIDNGNDYTCFTQWVKNGIFNIHTSAQVSVVDSSNSPIETVNHNDGVITFVMPDTDVTITLS